MEIAVGHHQPLFGATIQHPLMQGAVIYPGKGSAWQPVVTSLPPMAELPKESIIANTDFTTTSVLAKRRLSSKKRKKLENQQKRHSCDSTLFDGSAAHSPSDSAYGSSSSVTATTNTPPAQDRIELRHSFQAPTITTTSTSSHHQPLLHSSSSSFHPMVVHRPHTHAHSQPSGVLVSKASTLPANAVSLMPNQFSNPVLSHLQQELNYRFLSSGGQPEQSHTDQGQTSYNQMESSSQDSELNRMPSGIKWCNAHVSVAKMIQHHQAQMKAQEANTQSQPLLSTMTSNDPMDTTSSSQHLQGGHAISQTEPAVAMTMQQQQQLALLQMYGVHPTITSTAAAPSMQPTGGYLAMPYPTMHDVPLVQFAAVPQMDGTNSIAMIKPGMTSESVALALNPATAVQMGGSGVQHIQPYGHIATAVDAGNGGLVYHGGAVSGSWMAPVPMIGGSCIINPLNPGILAAPWVK